MDLGSIYRGSIGQSSQRRKPAENVLKCDRLQLATAHKRLTERSEPGFGGFAARSEAIEKTGAVKVLKRRYSRSIRLRLQISPFDKLSQRLLNVFQRRLRAEPLGFRP